jgi:hypothetical protein
MFWKEAGYAALCIAVPVLWGLGVYFASRWIETRALRHSPAGHVPSEDRPELPLDYYI